MGGSECKEVKLRMFCFVVIFLAVKRKENGKKEKRKIGIRRKKRKNKDNEKAESP